MRHAKKLLAGLTAAALMLTAAVPALAKSDFSDLDGHWAESYIEDLYDRGYISGYSDGTMKPDNSITACEALVFLSRFYSLTDDELAYVCADWGEISQEYVPTSLKWAYEEVAVCLAAGIISEDELDALDLSKEIPKETLCVFLVRALGLEREALELEGIELSFADAADISESATGHIAQLVSMGIITGDEQNRFTPKLGVTRAMAATLVSRGLDYLEDEDISLTLDGYSGLVRTEAIIAGVGSGYVQLRGSDGLVREFELSNGAAVTVNGKSSSLSSSLVGEQAEFSALDGEISSVAVTTDSDVQWVQGRVSRVSSASSGTYVMIDDVFTGETVKVNIVSSSELTLDGDEAEHADLSSGTFATARIDDDKLDTLDVVTLDGEIKGEISEIVYASTVQFKVKSGSTLYVFLLDISDLPTVKRGGATITIDRLAVGDEVEIAIDDAEVDTISSTATESGVTATLSAITVTSTGTFWVLEDDAGNEATYQLDSMASIYNGSKTISASDIKVGDTVSVSVYGNVITEVELVSAAQSSEKFSAEILSVDSGSKTITALYNGRLVYIDTSGATIISAATGKTVKLSSVEEGGSATFYGSFETSNSFEATSIIIES